MGASRKLQGEIDRVLKKVQEGVDVFDGIWNKVYDTENANQKEKFEADLKKEIKKLQRYRDQIKTWIQSSEIKDKKALLDARKLIEREMERFKVCEKETKTKAFSKEGLGQQPKTDPKEKAKSETRDWLNNVVGELESQIDYFEADVEGLSVKKGKTRPPRLTHLETSIARHKAHIMKLELILRLLDNDELSPEQVNDVRDFLDDYVERNQEDFEEFNDVDELYSSLPLDMVESLEDLVTIAPPGLVKAVGSVSTGSTVLGLKSPLASPTLLTASLVSTTQQSQDQAEETASQDSNSDIAPRTPTPKTVVMGPSVSSTSSGLGSAVTSGTSTTANSVPARGLGGPTTSILSGQGPVLSVMENPTAAASSSLISMATSTKEDNTNFPGHRSSPILSDVGVGRGISRGSVMAVSSSQASVGVPLGLSSGSGIPSNGALGAVPAVSELAKRNTLGADERVASSPPVQQLISPFSNRVLLQQVSNPNDGNGSTESNNVVDGATLGGRVFTPSVVSGVQWRPPSATSFQTQNEMGQFRGRTEIAPDQREKFLLRLQQVQQQGHSNLLGVPHLPGSNHKQFTTQQQNTLLQQLNSQNSPVPSQVGLGFGVQAQGGLSSFTSTSQQQQNALQQPSPQHALISTGPKEADVAAKMEDLQQQQKLADESNLEPSTNSGLKNLTSEDDLKMAYTVDTPIGGPGYLTEASQVPRERDTDLSPGQPLQSTQSSAGLGVIGRRSISDLGAIGDNLTGSTSNFGGMHDQMYNLQMLQAAYYRLPQPKDSERLKSYIPRHPAQVPSSYPQVQAPFVDNPAFWERLGAPDAVGTDTLFFAFYFQQNTYQQYLAARELKKQSWRYHRKYNTWFQRHEEPIFADENHERGTYVYFDFHIANDDYQQQGWCQRIKTEFTFEYCYLEDEIL